MSEVALEYLPESKKARAFLIGLGKNELSVMSATLALEIEVVQDGAKGISGLSIDKVRTLVRLRSVIETLLGAGSVSEMDMMALAWWAREKSE